MKPSTRRKIGAVLAPLIWLVVFVLFAFGTQQAIYWGYAAGVLQNHQREY